MKIVEPTADHAFEIAKNMRQADIDELSKTGVGPHEGLLNGLTGDECFTVILNGIPVMMFGVVRSGFNGVVWALGTDDINSMKKTFVKSSFKWRDYFLCSYMSLYNWVDVDNKKAIQWLKFIGAKFSNPEQRGTGTFMRFDINV